MKNLILIPPLGHDQKFYDPLAKLLETKFNLIRLDYPYVLKHSDFNWDAPDLLTELAIYFIREIKKHTQDVHYILGVSLGATISYKINDLLQGKVEKLFLISSGGFIVAPFRKEIILQSLKEQGRDNFLKLALSMDRGDFHSTSFIKNFTHPSKDVETYWKYYTEVLWNDEHFNRMADHLLKLMNASLNVNFESLIEKFQKQEVIIWGEIDKVFSMRFYRKFQEKAPAATFHLMNGIGHFSPLETPETIFDIMKGYESPKA